MMTFLSWRIHSVWMIRSVPIEWAIQGTKEFIWESGEVYSKPITKVMLSADFQINSHHYNYHV